MSKNIALLSYILFLAAALWLIASLAYKSGMSEANAFAYSLILVCLAQACGLIIIDKLFEENK